MLFMSSLPKVPLLALSEEKIEGYLQTVTRNKVQVSKEKDIISIQIKGQKVVLPSYLTTITPQELIDSLKEKGLIP